MRRHLCLVLIGIAAACSDKAQVDGRCGSHIITGDGVGDVHGFMSVDSLRNVCRVLREWTDSSADVRSRHLIAIASGRDTIVAVIADGIVQEIRVTAPSFKTKESIGIGTSLSSLLNRPGVGGYSTRGRVQVQVESICGLLFRIRTPITFPNGRVLEKADLARLPSTSSVDQITAMGGCTPDKTPEKAHSTTVTVDSIMLERDLDGSGTPDFVVREKRVSSDANALVAHRVAVYLDTKPGTGAPTYASRWDDEFGGESLDSTYVLAPGVSLLALGGSYADYDAQTFLLVQRGQVREEIVTGQDYGRGRIDVKDDKDEFTIDASVMHLMLRGAEVNSDLVCGDDTDYAAVLFHFDAKLRQFVADKPRCVKDKPA